MLFKELKSTAKITKLTNQQNNYVETRRLGLVVLVQVEVGKTKVKAKLP